MRFFTRFRFGWALIVASLFTLGLAGCEGDDGSDGSPGTAGTPGADGESCWDLNANGVRDLPDEDLNSDGVVDTLDCNANANPVTAAVENAKPESCGTCHEGAGGQHQALYDRYVDTSALDLTLTGFTSVAGAPGEWDVTLNLTITKDGAPFTDWDGLNQKRFFATQYDSATREYIYGFVSLNDTVTMVADGDFVVTETGLAFDPTDNGQVYGYIADDPILEHEGGTGAELPAGTHVHLYDNIDDDALAWGEALATDPNAYESYALASGCENCHGTPYAKHGYRKAEVDPLPDFASCKVCHNDPGDGGHFEWQYMVDEPFNWATGVVATADYSYKRTIMNDTHMSHAMEFPYPQSVSTCNTCHEGYLAEVLDNSNFTAETCQSCHPIQGIDAWPSETYYQGNRAPAFDYLWQRDEDLTFHDVEAIPNCQACHGNAAVGAPAFSDYHSGYDRTIYDDLGTRYADTYTVSIDSISLDATNPNLMTVEFSASDAAVVPELLVSFYGWDTKHFLVGSHERDANPACSGFRPGCKMEYVPESSGGNPNPLFTEDPASAPPNWIVTLDMAALQLTKTDDLPTLIANGDITKAEVAITPELELGGMDVILEAVGQTYDLVAEADLADYFKDANATVDLDKCNVCHDVLASSFHDGSGRGGDGIEVCKHCHTTTFPGSHIEMASRAIDSYVHAIHSFQDFDVGDTFEEFDAVDAKRYDQHIKHVFPNFTIRNCESCHVDGMYEVPDQAESMFGVMAKSDFVATWYSLDMDDLAVENPSGRNIGTVPELVSGPASRACGACHRSRLINQDEAGALVSLNAHTESFGTLEENDDDDAVLFGIIDKIASLFE